MSHVPSSDESVARMLRDAVDVLGSVDATAVSCAARALLEVRARSGVIYTAGNGGSASTASHLAVDLQKTARTAAGMGTRAICLSESPGLVTAWGNDTAFERVFAEQLEVLGRPGDGLVVLSVSGSSPNLIALLEVAKRKLITSVGLLGRDGGEARDLVDVAVVVPSGDYGWVESAHVVLAHVVAYALREAVASDPAAPEAADLKGR